MAALPKSGTPSLATREPGPETRLACIATADIAAGDACYLNGTVRGQPGATPATGAAANAAAVVEGFAAAAAQAGQPVTLYRGDVHFHYGSGMTPGTPYYLSGTTAGGLDTDTSTGGTVAIARAIDATRLRVFGNL